MKIEPIIRRVDEFHRVQLPRAVWQELNINVGDWVELTVPNVTVDGKKVILRKVEHED